MKVTGYQIRERIRVVDLRLKALQQAFTESLSTFKGEDKLLPLDVDKQIHHYEQVEAQLQVLQARYNLAATLKLDKPVNLHYAVKLIGGLGRRESRWREVAAPKASRGYGYNNDVRDPAQEYAQPTVSKEEAMNMALKTAREAGTLRAAINQANAQEVDLEFDPKLFED